MENGDFEFSTPWGSVSSPEPIELKFGMIDYRTSGTRPRMQKLVAGVLNWKVFFTLILIIMGR